MDNKNLKVFLFISALIIWGFIIYKIINFLNGNSGNSFVALTTNIVDSISDVGIDTIELSFNYNDPFFPTVKANTHEVTKKYLSEDNQNKIIRASHINNMYKDAIWPKITYKGNISNSIQNKITGILIIDGIDFLVSPGTKCNEITVDKIYPDSICLIYSNENKTFKKY